MVGSILALVALAASLMNNVDPIQCLIRGLVAFAVGNIAAVMWNILIAGSSPNRAALAPAPAASPQEDRIVETTEATPTS